MNKIIYGKSRTGEALTVDLDGDQETLKAVRDEIEIEMIKMKAQIAAAELSHYATGERSDWRWLANAKTALRFKGQAHQMVLRRLGEHKKRERADDVGTRFIDIAKRRLDPVLFESLLNEAKERT